MPIRRSLDVVRADISKLSTTDWVYQSYSRRNLRRRQDESRHVATRPYSWQCSTRLSRWRLGLDTQELRRAISKDVGYRKSHIASLVMLTPCPFLHSRGLLARRATTITTLGRGESQKNPPTESIELLSRHASRSSQRSFHGLELAVIYHTPIRSMKFSRSSTSSWLRVNGISKTWISSTPFWADISQLIALCSTWLYFKCSRRIPQLNGIRDGLGTVQHLQI